jgi:uncharacterized phage protein (TIGR02220 family)
MHRGYVKIWRKMFDSGIQKEPKTFTMWVWLLCNVTRNELNYIVRGECIKLNPGEIIIGRKKLSIELGISDREVRTCLHHLETWGNVSIRATKRFSILNIVNWSTYQDTENKIDQQEVQEATKKRPRSDHKTRSKEYKNKYNMSGGPVFEVIEYLNLKAGKKFDSNGANAKFVSARLKDGATVDECKAVIDMKVQEWLDDPKMSLYLRPETLFNATKFEGYKNSLYVGCQKPKNYAEVN